MSPSLKYAATGTVCVSVIVAGLWPFLDAPGRSGVMTAGLVALSVQMVAFALLHRLRGGVNTFLAAWVGGTLVRMAVVGVFAFVFIRSGGEGAVPALLALAGFFFGLLLLEPIYFRLDASKVS